VVDPRVPLTEEVEGHGKGIPVRAKAEEVGANVGTQRVRVGMRRCGGGRGRSALRLAAKATRTSSIIGARVVVRTRANTWASTRPSTGQSVATLRAGLKTQGVSRAVGAADSSGWYASEGT
jgi:hypothetical protein